MRPQTRKRRATQKLAAWRRKDAAWGREHYGQPRAAFAAVIRLGNDYWDHVELSLYKFERQLDAVEVAK